jgi:hypothetical protein
MGIGCDWGAQYVFHNWAGGFIAIVGCLIENDLGNLILPFDTALIFWYFSNLQTEAKQNYGERNCGQCEQQNWFPNGHL